MAKKFYITSAIPYVNAKPHIGHALEFVQTDAIARYHRLLGDEVLKLCGGDENALKNVQAAEKAGSPVQGFVDRNNLLFQNLADKLNASYDIWQKGSSEQTHFPSSQELWRRCAKDIYKKSYEGLYCVGCEVFYAPDELNENGECFEHPGKKLDTVKEDNYFFRLSGYTEKITRLITSGEIAIIPEKRKNEVLAFLGKGLQDISISRSNERAKNWGVPVPGDASQRMYVWFDALNIYQSGIGFGWDDKTYRKWWPADIHVIGKGITRFHAVYWPAFLLSAGLEIPKKIFVHEYFTVNGQKMSKTLGNVIDPISLIDKYGTDPLRYYFLAKFSPFSDGDFSEKEFRKTYNADLANGLGNLVARVAAMANGLEIPLSESFSPSNSTALKIFGTRYEFDKALGTIWDLIKACDVEINETKTWSLSGREKETVLHKLVHQIRRIAYELKPFLPETAEKIQAQYQKRTVRMAAPLFPRLR